MKKGRILKSRRLNIGAKTFNSMMKNAARKATAIKNEVRTKGEVQPMALVPYGSMP